MCAAASNHQNLYYILYGTAQNRNDMPAHDIDNIHKVDTCALAHAHTQSP